MGDLPNQHNTEAMKAIALILLLSVIICASENLYLKTLTQFSPPIVYKMSLHLMTFEKLDPPSLKLIEDIFRYHHYTWLQIAEILKGLGLPPPPSDFEAVLLSYFFKDRILVCILF